MILPDINDAKRLAYANRATAVIVIQVCGDGIGYASYGMTRRQCTAAGKLLDNIADAISTGRIAFPPDLGKAEGPLP